MSRTVQASTNPILPSQANLCVHIAIALFVLMSSGCAFFTIDTMRNQPLPPNDPPQKTRATEKVIDEDLYNGKFIGISLSGGGSRAANFSAAVLFELDNKLQVLDKITAISSVSGGSLPAAYYGLYGHNKSKWQAEEVRKELIKDYETRWIMRWFLPQNALRYWTTNFSRSDIMKDVLDSNLFHKKTFADMGSGRPHILINSTSLARGERFLFSEESFSDKLNSRIDTYPIANSVMASSAFPGAFHDMTLHDFSGKQNEKEYAHVIDGGPFDNLGITPLLDMANRLPKSSNPNTKCLLFVVDAYPYPIAPKHVKDADSRSFIDYFVDSNVAEASDALLTVRRGDLLDELNVDFDNDSNIEPFHLASPDDKILLDNDAEVSCGVWHIGLPRLLSPEFQKYAKEAGGSEEKLRELAMTVNSIPTRYKLTSMDNNGKEISPEKLQEDLFTAAQYLIHYDKTMNGKQILEQVRTWLNNKN